jgi:hypothetical protein
VTLGRLVFAWILVAIWFYASLFVTIGILMFALNTWGTVSSMGNIQRSMLYWRALEAMLVTLFASLWFDSLGSGGWWLVFLMVGILVAVPTQLINTGGPDRKVVFAATVAGDLIRYVVAGALLAWRLS